MTERVLRTHAMSFWNHSIHFHLSVKAAATEKYWNTPILLLNTPDGSVLNTMCRYHRLHRIATSSYRGSLLSISIRAYWPAHCQSRTQCCLAVVPVFLWSRSGSQSVNKHSRRHAHWTKRRIGRYLRRRQLFRSDLSLSIMKWFWRKSHFCRGSAPWVRASSSLYPYKRTAQGTKWFQRIPQWYRS